MKFPRNPQEITVNLTVKVVPNPNPQRGIDLLAGLLLKQILLAETKGTSANNFGELQIRQDYPSPDRKRGFSPH